MDKNAVTLSEQGIGRRIYEIRGHRVMLDSDLAEPYGVETKALNRAVRRNIERFPIEFMFELTPVEWENLRCQIGTLRAEHGRHRKYMQLVFTEQGVAQLSSVLHSPRAIQVNIAIIKTFVKVRRWLETNRDLAKRLDDLESKYDGQFQVVFDAIRQLMSETSVPRKQIKGLAP